MHHVEVSKLVSNSWLFVLENAVGRLVRSRDRSLHRSAGVQANLEGINAISRTVCESLQKMSGIFLILSLEYVQPRVMMLLVTIRTC